MRSLPLARPRGPRQSLMPPAPQGRNGARVGYPFAAGRREGPRRRGPSSRARSRTLAAAERRPRGLHFWAARPPEAADAAAAAAGWSFFRAARSSSQIVIGPAMNQVEYVPETMPNSIAAEKSKIVPTP